MNFNMVVSKESLRKVVEKKRLPHSMLLYLTGAVLYDLLAENGEEDSFALMNTTYCMGYRSINRKQVILCGRFELTRKAIFELPRMKRFVNKDPYLNAQFYTYCNSYSGEVNGRRSDDVYIMLFKKFVRGHGRKERAYRNA